MLLFSLVCACARPPGSAPTPAPVEPAAPEAAAPAREAFEKPENAYFYFLAAQKERRAGQTDKAILLLRKAMEAEPDSAYLQR